MQKSKKSMAANSRNVFCFPCSVTASCDVSKSEDRLTEIWSGFGITENAKDAFVVTHLLPLVKFVSCESISNIYNKQSCLLGDQLPGVTFQCNLYKSGQTFFTIEATPLCAWKCARFDNLLKNISSNIPENKNSEPPCCKSHLSNNFLSWAMLLKINLQLPITANEGVRHGIVGRSVNLRQGNYLWVQSHPFGPTTKGIFSGCLTTGILSNIVQDSLLLTDACCLPGSEGAPVFTHSNELIGMVVSPLAMKSGDLSGLTFICSWPEIVSSFYSSALCHMVKFVDFGNVFFDMKFVKHHPSPTVVQMKHMKGWGSGIVVAVDKCTSNPSFFVVTCCHVVQPADQHVLHIRVGYDSDHSRWFQGLVVYVAPPSWFDFALVQVRCNVSTIDYLFANIHFDNATETVATIPYCKDPRSGIEVYAKGHCLFENIAMLPTITSGILSSVAYEEGKLAVLLHSTCVVHDGASGGALVSYATGDLLGLIVNNVKETNESEATILYPKVNFSLPAMLFMPVIEEYLLGNKNALNKIKHLSSIECDVWKLNENELSVPKANL